MPDNKAIDAQYCAESLAEAVDNWRNDRDNEALMQRAGELIIVYRVNVTEAV